MSKSTIKYTISKCRNPYTGETFQHPVITDRETYTTERVIERGLASGYVRGQFHDIRGVLDGSIATWQQLLREGKAVHIGKWLRLALQATGRVGADRQLTGANELRLRITPLEDLKVKASDYIWECVDDTTLVPRIDYGSALGSPRGEMSASQQVTFSGRNLNFNPEKDTVTLAWKKGDEVKTATVSPTGTSGTILIFDWPEALAEADAGTEVIWSFLFHVSVGTGTKEVLQQQTLKLVEA